VPEHAPAAHVRPASVGDLAALAPLFDAYRQFYGFPADPLLSREYLAARLARAESLVLLAEDAAGQATGFCQMYPTWDSLLAAPLYVLYDLYVAPANRRGGTARALMLAAQDLARARGAKKMELSTARSNLAAQALYESLGWVRSEQFLTYGKLL
jgi:ribosomal protein S18 acetylase RimI-like enzyme